MDYSQIEASLANVRDDIIKARQRFVGGVAAIGQANGTLGVLATTYGAVLQAITDGLAADPTDTAFVILDARRDKLVAEYLALKAETQTAVDALTP